MKQLGAGGTPGTNPDQDKANARKDATILKRIIAARIAAARVVDELAEIEDLIAKGPSSTAAIYIEFKNAWERKNGRPYVGAAGRYI